MRPLDEQTILITGSTDGLGEATAERLAEAGANVLVHGRHPQKLERVVEHLGAEPGVEVHGLLADLSHLDNVRRLARHVESEVDRLDVLVNNAGVAVADRRESADGHELTFAVNYLSHFLLTAELLPLLRRSTPARIVNVASIGQAAIDLDDPMLERDYDGFLAYRKSKLAQIMFTIELAGRLEAAGERNLTVNAVHPATLMDTNMVRQTFGGQSRSEISEGVESLEYLVTSPELEGVTGRYFDQLAEAAADPQAYDAGARRVLWELSEELCDVTVRL